MPYRTKRCERLKCKIIIKPTQVLDNWLPHDVELGVFLLSAAVSESIMFNMHGLCHTKYLRPWHYW